MNKPITLHIPHYYEIDITDKNQRLALTKTEPLCPGDHVRAAYMASIENVQNYVCDISEISEAYREIATNKFHNDRAKGYDLPTAISDCKVYSYNWDDDNYHFKIFWIILSEEHMLQLVSVVDPLYSSFFNRQFMMLAYATQIDKTFSYAAGMTDCFEIQGREIAVDELIDLIEFKKQESLRIQYLKENLTMKSPRFFSVLKEQLAENDTVTVESFICTDWNMYYDLHNPENFSDPDAQEDWQKNDDVFDYFEVPYTNNTETEITCYDDCNVSLLEKVATNSDKVENNLLSFFERYTFGNGGAYAAGVRFEYAKVEIERLHNQSLSYHDFLKRNLCLQEINLDDEDSLSMHFRCSWDAEHGVTVWVDEEFRCSIKD
ncbi:hypothetical protein [Fulvivirga ligni]|uniref:hypothetical protein n=1 Tax=Fulvivirga ligni TaxID=2904246 RepID=UPI001F3FDE7B|nr:hypothetical protein [Fulvivirga ligni]UII20299.1 hypothetical protein LVD16_20870 [Fulvivirga ligni]